MKILFVDNSAELQQKWIDPLRAEGWGALRARSAEDADRMLLMHGDSLNFIVVSEELVQWAEKQEFPFLVLVSQWKEKQILQHQNSPRSAIHYLSTQSNTQELKNILVSYQAKGKLAGSNTEKAEKTKWTTTRTIALEEFSGVLSKPEPTKSNTGSIKLEAPQVTFGGAPSNANQDFASEAPLKFELTQSALKPLTSEQATQMNVLPTLEPVVAPLVETPQTDALPIAESSSESASEATTIRPLPEVAEVKIEAEATRIAQVTQQISPPVSSIKLEPLGAEQVLPEPQNTGSIQLAPPEVTAAQTQITPEVVSVPLAAAPAAADPTVVLEATQVELSDEEISQQIEAMSEEESVEELSINEHVAYPQAVGQSFTPPFAQSSGAPYSHAPAAPHVTPPPVVRVIEGDEALKNYLSLREQDVAILTGQVRSAHERIQQLEMQVKLEKARSIELQQVVTRQEKQLNQFENEKQVELEVLYRQIEDLNQQMQERSNRAHLIEAKLRLATDEVNKVKERVRVDIRRIRVREKELAGQLEILKKDSAALLQARDEKILELKRKIDLLEYNMELVQEQYQRERQSSEDLRGRLKDAAQAMRKAGGLLEQ